MRVSVDRMAGEKDLAAFVLEYGSGNQIPDPFYFVNYSPPGAIPSASSQSTSRIAEFTRSTSRELSEEGLVVNAMDMGDKKRATSRRNDPYVGGRESVVEPSSQSITVSSKAQPIPYPNDIQLTASLKEGPVVGAADIGDRKEATNDPDVGESVVGASSHLITVSRAIPYTNDIRPSASMINLNGDPDPFTTPPLEQLQNTIPTSQNAIRPLPTLPTVLVSMVPKSTQPAGVLEVAQGLANRKPAFEEHMSPSERDRTSGRHALSMNQVPTTGGGGTLLPSEIPYHDPSNLVWKSPSKPLLQGVHDVLDSDSDEADESGSYYSAVDESEMHMPVMLPQMSGQLDLFLKQHEHNSSNSNVNPINFVIKKMLKARRIAHRTSVRTYSTSKSSISKLGTNSVISYSSE